MTASRTSARLPKVRAQSAAGAPDVSGAGLARNTALNLLGLGLPLVVALIAVPILLAGLGTDRFGLLGLGWMFIALSGEIGFGRAGTRFVAEALGGGRGQAIGRILRMTTGAQLVLGVLAGGALAALASWLTRSVFGVPAELSSEAHTAFLLVAATIPAAMLAGVLRGALEAAQRFDLVNLVRFVVSAASYLLPLVALWAGWGLVGVMALLFLGRVGAAVAYGTLVARVFAHALHRESPEGPGLRELLGFGGWVTASSLATPVLVYLDRFLLGALVSVAAVGVYTAPYELVTRLVLIPGSLAATLFPAFSTLRGMGRGGELAALMGRASRYVLGSVGPAATLLAVGAVPILSLWLGTGYAPEGAVALRILGLGVLASAVAMIPFSLLQAAGRADVSGKIHLAELAPYVLVAWVLVARWGVAGAAWAWTLRALADAGLLYLAASREAPGWFRGERRRMAGTVACLALAGAGGYAVVRSLGSAVLAVGALCAGAVILMPLFWRVSLAREERARIVGFLNGVRA